MGASSNVSMRLRSAADPATLVVVAELNFAPGRSPFRAKGVLYLGSFEYFDRYIPGGRRAVFDEIRGDDLARFYEQQFLASNWYDALPAIAMQQASARITNQPAADYVRRLSRWQAERDVRGVYRLLLAVSSAEMIVERVPLLATRYFDFVKIEQKKIGPRNFVATITGIPAALATLYTAITEPFLSVAMETAGAKNVRFTWHPPEPDGMRERAPLVRIQRDLRWE